MDETITEKLQDLNQKMERLNKERKFLLQSNKQLIELLIELDQFIEHNVRSGKIEERQLHQNSINSSDTIDIEAIKRQIEEAEEALRNLEAQK